MHKTSIFYFFLNWKNNDMVILGHRSCLCNEISIETQKERIWRASGWVNTWEFGKSIALWESREAPSPFPIPCSMCLFHLVASELDPLIINWKSSKSKYIYINEVILNWNDPCLQKKQKTKKTNRHTQKTKNTTQNKILPVYLELVLLIPLATR